METSFYIIKPHGLAIRGKVREMIQGGGLTIAQNKTLLLPDWALRIIYDDLAEKWRDAVFQQFRREACEVGIVVGENAVDTLLQIAGTERDPIDCAPGSIRFEYGAREAIMVDGVRCYLNIIHRSRNKSEAEKDVRVFHAL